MRADRLAFYIGQVFVLCIPMVIGFIPYGMLIFVLGDLVGDLGFVVMIVVTIVYVVAMMLAFARLSVTLPAQAIGAELTLEGAWKATGGSTATLIVLGVANALFQFFLQFLFQGFALIPMAGPLLLLIPSILFVPLVNASILTTLYGIYVEGRSLS
ncbi:hypothetical protein ACFORG_06930 [Lutimaribacter marinistellae]|uniref:Glycerophosphoryl diester phosphodiesterase membrane domain-containing protein n=1 Tax=Lutimaribacter marinistellae TaxID=1820329 RepID=A0ABV7TF12_9RHOB